MTFKERKTVVGYDGSRSAQAALDWAATDARRRGSEVLILHVAEWGLTERPEGGGLPRLGPLEKASRAVLHDGLARVRRLAPEMPVTLESSLSGISRSLVEASCSAEMVVLGVPESRTVEGRVLGNTTATVVARAHCPVVVVSPGAQPEPVPGLPITVGYDGSPGAERALSFAAERAAQEGVPVVVVVAFSPSAGAGHDAQALGELAVARVRRCFPGVEVSHELTEGTAVPVLADASRGCGLIVVGNRGRGLMAGLLAGSVGNGLITRSHSPLAVVH
ncbi:universal stress protein [Kineosporia sp. J2-2]|uniref:Universal stress protein n=1 Tax=Kineosporia corallincola TaxID=2835133 RepID=A0ABS5TKE3_9ACTN|nr:universal stress protein [Kineosporia corallincola]MBT0771573.1 universal stress protein [Kineosporia corallincola]